MNLRLKPIMPISAISRPQFFYLSKNDESYGSYSSYYSQVVLDKVSHLNIKKINTPSPHLYNRAVGKAFSALTACKTKNSPVAYAQLRYLLQSAPNSKSICHILNVEDHLHFLDKLTRFRPNTLATIHFPPCLWTPTDVKTLRRLAAVITLCRRDQAFFLDNLDSKNSFFIRHGVNTAFFKPLPLAKSSSPRVIFVGKWLRDFEMAGKVLSHALKRWDSLEIDIVCPLRWFTDTSLGKLIGHPRVYHYERIDDLSLLRLYQKAWLLMLPLIETSANNAICEALSCGVVPLVNNVGGVPDYGGITHFPLVQHNCVQDYLILLDFYISHPADLLYYSSSVSKYAQQYLNWDLIKAEHLKVYRTLFPEFF